MTLLVPLLGEREGGWVDDGENKGRGANEGKQTPGGWRLMCCTVVWQGGWMRMQGEGREGEGMLQ